MKKVACMLMGASVFCMAPAHADDAAAASAGWRVQFGLTLASGVSDLLDKIEANNPSILALQRVPAGLALAVHREFGSGLGLGVTVGPILLARGDASFQIIPASLDVRYRFGPAGDGGLFIRAGVEKANASGDFVKSKGAGGVFAVGYDFSPASRFGWGLEAGVHTSKVAVKGTPGHAEQTAQPTRGTLAVYYRF